eukprot:s6600_g5.t1
MCFSRSVDVDSCRGMGDHLRACVLAGSLPADHALRAWHRNNISIGQSLQLRRTGLTIQNRKVHRQKSR